MKKLCLVDILILLLAICSLTACTTVSKTDSLEQEDYKVIYNQALDLAYEGNYTEAAQICQEAFEQYPYILAFKKAQAYYLTLTSDSEGACEVYLEILELNPYDSTTRKALISLYQELEMYDKALEQAQILWNQGYKTSENLKLIKEIYSSLS